MTVSNSRGPLGSPNDPPPGYTRSSFPSYVRSFGQKLEPSPVFGRTSNACVVYQLQESSHLWPEMSMWMLA